MDEKKVIATIKKVMPAVVSIAIAKRLEDVEKEFPPDTYPFFPKDPKKRGEVAGWLTDSRGMIEIGGGSGFIVEPNGLILTNKHIIGDPKAEYTVITNEGRRFPVEILSRDPINDVAMVKIKAKDLPTLKLGDASKLELGQTVIAIGNALGVFRNTVSLGIVSGLSRYVTAQTDPDVPFQEMRGLIQTDAAINPGNSGGPLVDLSGKTVGINAAVVSGAENINFAIPINAARRDLEDIKRYGHIRRPLLGVRYLIVDDNLKTKMNLPVNYGALIVKESPQDHGVAQGSPAASAGLREKDIILEVGSKKIDKHNTIQDVLDDLAVGEEVEIRVLRDADQFSTRIRLTERK